MLNPQWLLFLVILIMLEMQMQPSFTINYVWLVWMWANEGHKMRVSRSLLPHIHNVSLISLSLYQEAKLRWRWKIFLTCSVVTLMLMNQPLLDVGDTQIVTEWRKPDEMNMCITVQGITRFKCDLALWKLSDSALFAAEI